MAIFVTPKTKVLIQGITGGFGGRHTRLSLDYGTQVVAGVTPGKGGQLFENRVPIFDTVTEAVKATGATASAIFVPPPFRQAPFWKPSVGRSIWSSLLPEESPFITWLKSSEPM